MPPVRQQVGRQVGRAVAARREVNYRPTIKSRHPSHNVLRRHAGNLPGFPFRTVIRLGSTTVDTTRYGVEINSQESIRRSSNKLLMKEAFTRANVRTANWFRGQGLTLNTLIEAASQITDNWERKLVCKNHFGSKGNGNTLVSSEAELRAWTVGKTISNYIFERFMNFGHEFRLHVTADGYFYTCRKAMRRDTPEEERWHFHDTTCVWLLESNPEFKKPNSWDDIVRDCQRALTAIGADLLSFDVKVQSPEDAQGRPRVYQDYILLECNSASSLGDYNGQPSVCAQKYIAELPRLITRKAIELNLF